MKGRSVRCSAKTHLAQTEIANEEGHLSDVRSLDGHIEGANREIDWHLVDDEFNAYAVETLNPANLATLPG